MRKPKSEAEIVAGIGHSMIGALSDIHRVDEVQNILLIRLGEAVIETLGALGRVDTAKALADQFSLAADVLRAGADLTRDRLKENEEEE